MTMALCVRRFLLDYARNPVNVLMLVIVPVIFVAVAAQSIADTAELLGGAGGAPATETSTAGWAAGFLSGIAMYFQVSSARGTDRRLAIAGISPRQLVAARLLTGLILAALVTAVALGVLAARTGLDDPVRVGIGTMMFAAVYVGLGAIVGAWVPNPVNGTVLVLFVLIIDVFFGPTMITQDKPITRILPTHFVSLWMVDVPSGHESALSDLGWALVWAIGCLVAAFLVLRATVNVDAAQRGRAKLGSVTDQMVAATALGIRNWRRNPILWILLIVVPTVFIVLSEFITPSELVPMTVTEGGIDKTEMVDIANIHAATMAPIAVSSLAMLAGVFVVLDARSADQRLNLAGLRTGALLSARLAVVGLAVLLSTFVALAVTAALFRPPQWLSYALANLLLAMTFGLLGVLAGPVFGRISGAFIAFLVPFIDLGMSQSPMLRGTPPDWAQYLPGYAGMRILIDAAVTDSFDEARNLLLALGWIAALLVASVLVFRHMIKSPSRPEIGSALVRT
ncbi:MAG: ABC transporter permease [Candidatus Nanopelagicales bacterium]|nr:ABC transporter permease [Candidatus Nanopelagicales bacterium]MDZ4249335.1 ABC transporter permease [Candidatus Nanopelagicales bacterium]